MILTHRGVVEYWASEPKIRREPDGFIILGNCPFPDIRKLSAEEKELLRPILEKHPEYLEHEIWVESTKWIQ